MPRQVALLRASFATHGALELGLLAALKICVSPEVFFAAVSFPTAATSELLDRVGRGGKPRGKHGWKIRKTVL